MKEINIPKATKLIREQRRAPFTRRRSQTDLQVAVAGAEKSIYFCAVFIANCVLLGTASEPTWKNVLAMFLSAGLAVLMATTKIRLSKIRDYLIENNLQNLDDRCSRSA